MRSTEAKEQYARKTSGRTIPWAAFYDSLVRLLSLGKDSALRDAIVDRAQVRPGERVLDVGCGTGDVAIAVKALVEPGGEVIGIDASPEMIARARRKAAKVGLDVSFQVDLIEDISYPDDHFDIVTSSLMMHHLPDELKRLGLADVYRVLKPGGRVLIVDMQSTAGGSLMQRFSDLMIHAHGGHKVMQDNVSKLAPFVSEAGFTSLEMGKINRQLSFIRAQKPPSPAEAANR